MLILVLSARRIAAVPIVSDERLTGPVVINELLAANSGQQFVDEDGDPSDWIELANRSARTVDLAGWSLTDDPERPEKWIFQDTELAPGEHLVLFASGKDRQQIDHGEGNGDPGFLHTNFQLDATAGFLALYPPTSRRYLDGSTVDYQSQENDISLGRYHQSGEKAAAYGYFLEPTPGRPNPEKPNWRGRLTPVTFNMPHGLYDEPFRLVLSTDLSDAEIRYTLDGNLPAATNGLVYKAPLDLSHTAVVRAVAVLPDHLPGPVTTRSYLFLDDVAAQPMFPAGFPETWGEHRIDFGGFTAGDPVVADYEMDPAILADPMHGPQMADALTALPSLSLVLDMENFDIYADPQARGRDSERPVSVELIDAGEDEPGFQIDAGVRIQGGAGRWEFMPKHSFRLFFRERYGDSELVYPLFADSPVDEFDTLILRAGADRGFAGHPAAPEETVDHRQTTYARDEWTQAAQIDMTGTGVHGRFVHLYINGLYWGIYNLVERSDADFMASYFGGDEDNYASVNQAGSVSGMIDRVATLLRLAEAGGLDDADAYATMLEFIDPVQFSDYIILNWYTGNQDWPENNWYAGVGYPAGQNRFFVWDAEATLDGEPHVALENDSVVDAPFGNIVQLVFESLMENSSYQMLFADRLYLHTSASGALSDSAARQRWLTETEPLATAIVAEAARWGDARYKEPITQADWSAARDTVYAGLIGRGAKLRSLARDTGYYPPIDPPEFSVGDPLFEDELALAMTAASGDIYYTVDGADPLLPDLGQPSPSATRYEDPLHLNSVTPVKARAWDGESWSAMHEVLFYQNGQAADVRITELMYNPEGDERYEYLELANLGELPADLSGAYLEGIDYRFPEQTTLSPGEVTVLVSDFKRFRERYAEAEIAGIFEGKLSDRGETITLRSRDGSVIDSVSYEDGDGWPLSADGSGDSLVLVQPEGDPNQAHRWQASETMYGLPGKYNE